MYDIITRMPLVVWAPGRFKGGRSIDSLCQQMDIAPVIMELAGIETPESWETVSLMPCLTGKTKEPIREYVFSEQGRDINLTTPGLLTMIRSKEWKLVRYMGQSYGELYDMKEDPGEHNNLWDDPEHEQKKRKLLDAMTDWLMASNMKTSAWKEPWR